MPHACRSLDFPCRVRNAHARMHYSKPHAPGSRRAGTTQPRTIPGRRRHTCGRRRPPRRASSPCRPRPRARRAGAPRRGAARHASSRSRRRARRASPWRAAAWLERRWHIFFTGCPLKTWRHPLDRRVKKQHMSRAVRRLESDRGAEVARRAGEVVILIAPHLRVVGSVGRQCAARQARARRREEQNRSRNKKKEDPPPRRVRACSQSHTPVRRSRHGGGRAGDSVRGAWRALASPRTSRRRHAESRRARRRDSHRPLPTM